MKDALVTYKTEAAVGTLSAVSLGTTNAPNVVQESLLNAHLFEHILGSHYFLSVGDTLAMVGSVGVVYVLMSALVKFLRGKIQ